MCYCSQTSVWTKYSYNGHKLSQITDYCGNTRYTCVFHSRQWSNYNLIINRQSLSVDNTRHRRQRNDRWSMNQWCRSIGVSWYLCCFFRVGHMSTHQVFGLCGWKCSYDRQTDRQMDGQTTCVSKTVLCTVVHHAVKNCSLYTMLMATHWKKQKS